LQANFNEFALLFDCVGADRKPPPIIRENFGPFDEVREEQQGGASIFAVENLVDTRWLTMTSNNFVWRIFCRGSAQITTLETQLGVGG